ncbi:fluoride efflux transporter CrcB [Neobacillus sp. CF12]|uniref:fluoride efflux transporter CrcB n=1 Tax=Neobacillus sp. CF12 TaxID=3055864 RepID=UPI0025A24D46|nr:fluoride efflux transporter CrcB [Neobacillus sp. CF12]MDM5326603.1 fluoride efflux transporter CrcB [Neobacillus sp. CF12]
MKLFSVMFGGFIGAITRYSIGESINIEDEFPLVTLLINLLGCFLLGWFLTFISIRKNISPQFTLFFGTGFIGSFTTFSTFSIETILLFQNGHIVFGALYVLISMILGILLAHLGFKIALISREKGEAH